MTPPLQGIRVVELGSFVFVPSAAAVLAEWGAEVIKVERPEGGDPMRGMIVRDRSGRPLSDGMDRMNHNKRSIAVDVKTPRGREVLLDLCRTAHVFMTSWLPAARQRAGIDVADIHTVNPSIVYARGSGYGPKGSEANRGGNEATVYWARSGAAAYYAQQPEHSYAPFVAPSSGDLSAGQTLAGGIAAALVKRGLTGEGSVVDVSLLSEGIYGMSGEISRRRLHGDVAEPITHANATNPFMNQYVTADGQVIQMGMTRVGFWPDFMRVVGRTDLAEDPRFAASAIYENRVVAIAILDELFATRPRAEWAAILGKLDRGWEIVQKASEVCDDPAVLANGYLAHIERQNGAEPTPIIRNPVQFDEAQSTIHPAPELGEHTDTILAELGRDWDSIVDLKVSGVVL